MWFDIKLFTVLNGLAARNGIFDGLIVFFAQTVPYVLGIVFLLFLAFAVRGRYAKIRIFLVGALAGILARLGITELIRFFYHRPRPFTALPIRQLLSSDNWSFPSGHAAFFFAVSTVVFLYSRSWGIVFFSLAIAMTVSRIIAGIHYPSDILGGALVGIGTGYLVFVFAKKRLG